MTLAIGVSCPEGAVLLSDSLTMRFSEAGIESFLTAALKIRVLPRAQLAYVHSGASDETPVEDFDSTDFVDASRLLYGRLAAHRAVIPAGALVGATEHDGSPPSDRELARLNTHDLLVASTQTPLLGLLSDDGEQWAEHGIFVAGAGHKWWRDCASGLIDPPRTLRAAVLAAIGLAEAFKHYCYKEVDWQCEQGLTTKRSAPICPPWTLISISARGVEQWSQ